MTNSDVYIRPTWDEYFIKMMLVAGERATCNRGRSGCVITKDNREIMTGYVGSPPGIAHCDEDGHDYEYRLKPQYFAKESNLLKQKDLETGKSILIEPEAISQHCIRTVHAEANAIFNAAKNGIALDGCTLYCKMEPCYNCAMAIVSVGIKRVVAYKEYQKAQKSRELFIKAGVTLEVINAELDDYMSKS